MKLAELLSKITPLPYSVSDNSIVKGSYVCIAVIEDDGGCEAPIDERTANAAYLVHAANVLRGLVEALKAIKSKLDADDENSHRADDPEGAMDSAFEMARAALASAEEVNVTN